MKEPKPLDLSQLQRVATLFKLMDRDMQLAILAELFFALHSIYTLNYSEFEEFYKRVSEEE